MVLRADILAHMFWMLATRDIVYWIEFNYIKGEYIEVIIEVHPFLSFRYNSFFDMSKVHLATQT